MKQLFPSHDLGTGFPLTPDGGTVTITFPTTDPFILKV